MGMLVCILLFNLIEQNRCNGKTTGWRYPDNGQKDTENNGCEWYDSHPGACGIYETRGIFSDDDFDPNELCCACIEEAKQSK